MADRETEDPDGTPQSKGGVARAASLTPEERREIARRAATARWGGHGDIPVETHGGVLAIMERELPCYVLDNKQRVFSTIGLARALGYKKTGVSATFGGPDGPSPKLPLFVAARSLRPFISNELMEALASPIRFALKRSQLEALGYEATLLPQVCGVIIKAAGSLTSQQKPMLESAMALLTGFANVGIIALVDEATGYIADKRKDEYRKHFQAFVQKQCRQWRKEYPDTFSDMLYRLYGLKRKNPNSFQHPQFFGGFILKYIYHPLASSNGAILESLDEMNPVVYVGGKRRGRRYKLFQFLSEKVGVDAFRQHLWQVVGIGNSVPDKASFDRAFARAFPQLDPQLSLDAEYFRENE